MELSVLETQAEGVAAIEDLLRKTAAGSTETNARAVETARKEAQLIIREAEERSARLLDEARASLALLKEQIEILSTKKESIIRRLKLLLHSELDMVRSLESRDDPPAPGQAAQQESPPRDSAEIEEILRGLEPL